MADGYVVEAAGVTKRFRDSRGGALLTAVDCLDIRAARGKMTALIGPDGAGKTTFLRMVCGLMFPTEGILSVAFLWRTNLQMCRGVLDTCPRSLGSMRI